MTIAFIINYQRLTLPQRMADYIADCGVTPIILDNASDYPPLLEWYDKTPHKVVRFTRSRGNCSVWIKNCEILREYNLNGGYIVTDPDLEIDHIPKDWLHELQTGLDHYPDVAKAGFGLRIDDLPDTELAKQVRGNQQLEWAHPEENGRYYRASIDTTFALYRSRVHDFKSVRTGDPYLARHVTWYYDRVEDIPEDELYYIKTARPGWSYWPGRIKETLNI